MLLLQSYSKRKYTKKQADQTAENGTHVPSSIRVRMSAISPVLTNPEFG